MKDTKWIRADAKEGWQIVYPRTDLQMHQLNNEICPCKPKINFGDKIIVHNSFTDIQRIDKSISSLS